MLSLLFSLAVHAQMMEAIEIRKRDYALSKKTRYTLLPHDNTYILPVVYNWRPHEHIYQSIKSINPKAQNKTFYKRVEAEFQISFAAPLLTNIKKRHWDLMAAYTHHTWWQVYNSSWSRPFRETTYMPEIFSRYLYSNPKNIGGADLIALDLGYIHQSNGQIQITSKSWDRLFVRSFFKIPHVSFILTGWYRVPEKTKRDDNPDIYKFMGYGDLLMATSFNEHSLRLKIPLAFHHLSLDLKYSYPVREGLEWYASYQLGYGHSLIEYNTSTQRLGVGIALNNIFE